MDNQYDRSGTDMDSASLFFPPGRLSGAKSVSPDAFLPWDAYDAERIAPVPGLQDLRDLRRDGADAYDNTPDGAKPVDELEASAGDPANMVDAGAVSPVSVVRDMRGVRGAGNMGSLVWAQDDSGAWFQVSVPDGQNAASSAGEVLYDPGSGMMFNTATGESWPAVNPTPAASVPAPVPQGENPQTVFGTQTVQQWANAIRDLYIAGKTAQAQGKIMDLNLERAKVGLSPLPAGVFAQGAYPVGSPMSPAAQQLMKAAGIGLLAFLGFKALQK